MSDFSKTGHIILNDLKQDQNLPKDDCTITTFQEAVLNRVVEGLCVCHNIDEFPFVRFTVWNEQMTKITGYSREEINRLGWYQSLYPDPEIRNHAIARMDEMRTGNNLNAERWIITSADTSEKTVEITTSVLRTEKGQVHVFAMIEDVTEKIKEQERKEKLREQMARAEKMRSVGLLAGGVAHDLNNMLVPVVGYSDLLLEEFEGDEEILLKIRKIKNSAMDASEIVQDLLTLARRERTELLPVKFISVIKDCLNAPWYQHLKDKNQDINFEEFIQEIDVNILASTSHIKKAIMNLIHNAVDAMPTGGNLIVETFGADYHTLPDNAGQSDTKYVGISVSDSGLGIDKEMLPKIFEPYFSSKVINTSSGSGLGLAVVYGVLKDHNGIYDVKSEVGKGSKFTLYFPIAP